MADSQERLILAVDDSPDDNDILIGCLGNDYRISIATDGPQAMRLLDSLQPDIILLDILMPGMDGFQVCERIRANNHLKDVPVIFLTALTDTDIIIKGFKAGAADYITKPYNTDELSARVKSQIELKVNRDLIKRKNAEQRELLHVLCHDLCNTFTSVYYIANMLIDVPDKYATMLNHLKSSVKNGYEIINLVRELRTAEEKTRQIIMVNLKNCIDKSLILLQPQITEKGILITVDINPETHVAAEPISLVNSVFNNILTNAIKFSFSGNTIVIREENDENQVKVSFRDSGIGIPDELQKILFDISRNTSRKGTAGETGTGFGMPLIHKFMKSYGGTVEVISREADSALEDHGTIVNLSFKRKKA